jgi:uncharacterized protein DUF5615
MGQISFYLDEHIHRAVNDGLRRRGIDVLTVQEAGKSGLSDREQLGFALSERRVMVTMDSDFLLLASEGVQHAGIAYVNPQRSIGELIGSLMLVYDVLTSADMTNQVEYL